MSNWNKLLHALNQTFNTQTGATSTVKNVQRAFDNTTQEHVIWLEYRVKADIFESKYSNDETVAQSVTKPEKRKRLIDVITETALRGAW
ncbi:hypothetical protein D3C87_122130 [compost metagenome]